MDINYLQDIVSKLTLLDPSQHREAERLKIQTIEAFKQLFPNESQLIRQIQNLRFDLFQQMPNQHFRDMVLDSMNKLKSVIEAKIEVLKYLPVSKTQHDWEQSNQHQASVIKQHEHTIEQYRIQSHKIHEQLTEAGKIQSAQEAKIQTLEAQGKRQGLITKLKNGASIGLIIPLIGGIFTSGFYVGNTKYDKDKIDLSDYNRSLKDSVRGYQKGIEFMRNNSDSALYAIASMPYDKMKLDTSEYRYVQSTIEKGGAILYLNKNYKFKNP